MAGSWNESNARHERATIIGKKTGILERRMFMPHDVPQSPNYGN